MNESNIECAKLTVKCIPPSYLLVAEPKETMFIQYAYYDCLNNDDAEKKLIRLFVDWEFIRILLWCIFKMLLHVDKNVYPIWWKNEFTRILNVHKVWWICMV